MPAPEALTVTTNGKQAPQAVQTFKVALPAAMPDKVIILPFKLAWKMLPLLAPRLYGVVPPEMVAVNTCPTKSEALLWLKAKAPPLEV